MDLKRTTQVASSGIDRRNALWVPRVCSPLARLMQVSLRDTGGRYLAEVTVSITVVVRKAVGDRDAVAGRKRIGDGGGEIGRCVPSRRRKIRFPPDQHDAPGVVSTLPHEDITKIGLRDALFTRGTYGRNDSPSDTLRGLLVGTTTALRHRISLHPFEKRGRHEVRVSGDVPELGTKTTDRDSAHEVSGPVGGGTSRAAGGRISYGVVTSL